MILAYLPDGFKVKVTRQLESIKEKQGDSEHNDSGHNSSKNDAFD
jgi:hypothetical protein